MKGLFYSGCYHLSVMLGLFLVLSSCQDANLKKILPNEDLQNNKISVEGQVCTESPDSVALPVKTVFLLDISGSMLINDPNYALPTTGAITNMRRNAMQEWVNIYGLRDTHLMSMILFHGSTNEITYPPGYFQSNVITDYNPYLDQLLAGGGGIDGGTTDITLALEAAKLRISLDLASIDNIRMKCLTTYSIVIVSDAQDDDGLNNDFASRRGQIMTEVTRILNLKNAYGCDQGIRINTVFINNSAVPWTFKSDYRQLFIDIANMAEGVYKEVDPQTSQNMSFQEMDFQSFIRSFRLDTLVVFNHNHLPNGADSVDSDGDGLLDTIETEIGTSRTNRDSDGDGLNDYIERILSKDPLNPGDTDCDPATDDINDLDGDRLTGCEERYLGLDDENFDSDMDGITDGIEVLYINHANDNRFLDTDSDATSDIEEYKKHTSLLSSDGEEAIEYAYSYILNGQGVNLENRFCYDFKIGNITLVDTLATAGPKTAGLNKIAIYLLQRPNDFIGDIGVLQVGEINVRYHQGVILDPPTAHIELDPTILATFNPGLF